MTAAPKKPMAEANRLSSMLNLVLGEERFPVKVDEVALEYSRQCCPDDPIDKVMGEPLEGFEGMLTANRARSKWLVLYNNAMPSMGRQRFTIAHELGHYLLHRDRQDQFECGSDDIETADGADERRERQLETEADQFASALLMPLDDFRRQVDGQPIGVDLLNHCAARYGASLTAAALKWIDVAPERAILVASGEDHLLWAKSNEAAYRSGAYFATRKQTIEVPAASLAHSSNGDSTNKVEAKRAQVWLPREPASMPLTEMTLIAAPPDYTLTLLLMPHAERRTAWGDETAEEDTLDRFERNGQPLQR